MELIQTEFKHVDNLWDDAKARQLDPVERLVYRSNLLGTDWRITNTGGGNTSSKLMETDPLTGEEVEVLWVKGSGGDLRTSGRANFASLYMSRLQQLRELYECRRQRREDDAEDRMVAMYPHAVFDLNPRASSIDTPLHGLLPPPTSTTRTRTRSSRSPHRRTGAARPARSTGTTSAGSTGSGPVSTSAWRWPSRSRRTPDLVGLVMGSTG